MTANGSNRWQVTTAAVFVIACALVSRGDAAENALSNPSFEQLEGGLPVGWTRYVGDAHTGGWQEYDPDQHRAITMTADTEQHRKGEKSIHIHCDQSTIAGFAQKVAVKGDAVYLFSVRVKSENLVATGEGGAVTFHIGAEGEELSFQYIDLRMMRGTRDWFRVRKLVKTPAGAGEMRLCLYGLFNGSGKVWMDDAQFIRLR